MQTRIGMYPKQFPVKHKASRVYPVGEDVLGTGAYFDTQYARPEAHE